ncbi:SNW/SKI-interacting protein-like [Tripterygium wilfordii]|uniref:SNW/SKI-interacting protein-like n=1 Tax=Tripterygium wilfordii TaxID=458696 RepID=UPI0018F81448|nr:SNW/SKI-interacting protein-like [Tripterygium wilfordii]XP_038705327.1 SNW/SKI-interacting protein-like [Tripterygium wilfordii]XP_038705328.1 SNW/SKI-interacting protein-like [Tripterygium wilfordii]XP_038705329.1 SNW/SKI-interacting protein-like [Tripterygium wilfordii]
MLSEALYDAEQKAREEAVAKFQKEMLMKGKGKGKERKEQELQALAAKAQSDEKTGVAPPSAIPIASENGVIDGASMTGDYETVRRDKDMPKETREEREEQVRREEICEEQPQERERERRLEEAEDAAMGKRRKITRDRECDISEKADLAVASAGAARGGHNKITMFDRSLFVLDQTLSRPRIDADDIDMSVGGFVDNDAEGADDPFGLGWYGV